MPNSTIDYQFDFTDYIAAKRDRCQGRVDDIVLHNAL